MKIRHGFVSNSSSSSFVIKGEDLTTLQLLAILNHKSVAKWLGMGDVCWDDWDVTADYDAVEGRTSMDNFSMREFFEKIGVPSDVVEWDD